MSVASELVVADGVHLNQNTWLMVTATKSSRPNNLPPWGRHMENRLVLVPISKLQYICMVVVKSNVTEAIIDAGRARLLVSLWMDRKLSLPV